MTTPPFPGPTPLPEPPEPLGRPGRVPPPQPVPPAPPPPAPYGTPDAPRLRVRGEALLDVEPEVARIGITVSARGKDRGNTLDEITHRNSHTLELLKSYGEAVDRLDTGAFAVTPELADRRGEKVRGYRGSVRINATVTDFTALGELTTRLADLELTRVDGPWWSLRHDSPAYRKARQEAVRAAVQRAREYAQALGARLTALVELSDTGLEAGPPTPLRGLAAGPAGGYADGAAELAPPLDLEPQRQTVQAQVTADFIMSRPDLGDPRE